MPSLEQLAQLDGRGYPGYKHGPRGVGPPRRHRADPLPELAGVRRHELAAAINRLRSLVFT